MEEEPVMKELLRSIPQRGKVAWISVRPGTRKPVEVVEEVVAIADKGLAGDRYKGGANTTRQVTLIQGEHLQTVASIMGMEKVDPALLRRNIVVTGINLLSLKNQRFRIGEALLETTGLCHPCSRMEEVLGNGGYNAMRGHGGITARVVNGGTIKLGDTVELA